MCKCIIQLRDASFPDILHTGRIIPPAVFALFIHELVEFCLPLGHFLGIWGHVGILHLVPDTTGVDTLSGSRNSWHA